jgi:outer membrane protein
LVAALVLFTPALAQSPAPAAAAAPRIGYLDVKRLIDSAPQSLKSRAKLEREFAQSNTAIQAGAAKLAALKQRYERDNAIMTRDDADALKREIEATERDNKSREETTRAEFNNRGSEDVNRNLRLFNDVAVEVARSQGYDMVVGSQAVLYASSRVDITDAVLQRLKELAASDAKP